MRDLPRRYLNGKALARGEDINKLIDAVGESQEFTVGKELSVFQTPSGVNINYTGEHAPRLYKAIEDEDTTTAGSVGVKRVNLDGTLFDVIEYLFTIPEISIEEDDFVIPCRTADGRIVAVKFEGSSTTVTTTTTTAASDIAYMLNNSELGEPTGTIGVDTWDVTAPPADTSGIIMRISTGAYYDDTAGTPQLKDYYRDYTFDSAGKLILIGAEASVVIDEPIDCDATTTTTTPAP